MSNRVSVELPDGRVIRRVPHVDPLGNFVFMWIWLDTKKYVINEGDEYMHGRGDMEGKPYRLNFRVTGKGKPEYVLYPSEDGSTHPEMQSLRVYVTWRLTALRHGDRYKKFLDEQICWAVQDYLSSKGEFSEDDVAYLREHQFAPEDFYPEGELSEK